MMKITVCRPEPLIFKTKHGNIYECVLISPFFLALFSRRHKASHHTCVLASLQLPPLARHHRHPRWDSVHLWHGAAVVLPKQETLSPSQRSGCAGTAELPPAVVSRAGQGLRGSVVQLLQPRQRLLELHEL